MGTFTIGGGLVAITLMQQALVDTGVVTAEQFFNMVAISEATPGPIGINMATYVGFSQYGVVGALVTTAGEVLPSIVCIIIVARLFMKVHDSPWVKSAFSTLRPATTGVILVAALRVFTVALVNADVLGSITSAQFLQLGTLVSTIRSLFMWRGVVFYAVAVAALFRTKLHPIILVACGALFGIVAG